MSVSRPPDVVLNTRRESLIGLWIELERVPRAGFGSGVTFSFPRLYPHCTVALPHTPQ